VAKIYGIGFSEDWQQAMTVCRHLRPAHCQLPGLPVQVDPDIDSPPFDMGALVNPILCFALLNCRNVVAEDVHQDKKHPWVRGERDHRPYCSYKVLRLEVPHRLAERPSDAALDADDDGPKVRLHLCRAAPPLAGRGPLQLAGCLSHPGRRCVCHGVPVPAAPVEGCFAPLHRSRPGGDGPGQPSGLPA
jgi:hypothetical protein